METYVNFFKSTVVFNKDNLTNKVIGMRDLMFPISSVLHLLDNFGNNTPLIKDIFQMAQFPFIDIDKTTKWLLLNNSEYNQSILLKANKNLKIRFLSTGLTKNLSSFIRGFQKNPQINPILSNNSFIKKLTQKSFLGIINHNPLYRSSILGVSENLKSFYKEQFILNNILDFISTSLKNKHNYIFIPIDQDMKDQRSIIRTILNDSKLQNRYLSVISGFDYLVTSMLALAVDKKIEGFLFNNYSDKNISTTNFVFYNPTIQTCQVFNLAVLQEMLTKGGVTRNDFLNALHRLAFVGIDSKPTEPKTIKDDDIPEPVEIELPDKKEETPPVILAEDLNILSKATPKQFVTELTQIAQDNIKLNRDLTPAQKERQLKLMQKSLDLDIEIDGKSMVISDLLNKKIDITLEANRDFTDKIDKSVMDESYAKSNILDLNQEYYKKLFYQDMFKSLMSFQKTGLILEKYQEETIKTDLTMAKKIEATFTNLDGKKKKIHYEIPIPDDDGCFIYNGVKSYMKKQLTNIPLVKINKSRVSIASSYGKIIVERDPSVTYDFGGHILRSLEKHNQDNPDKKISFIRQTSDYKNIKVPFDYSAIGKNIKTLIYNGNHLIFDYNNRLSFNPKLDENKILELEKSFNSIFIGYTERDNHLLLIHNDTNVVQVIETKYKKVLSQDFIINKLLPQSYVITKGEWVRVFILNKKLPLAFVLAYKYGLSYLLDYLKIDYQLLDRSKRHRVSSDKIQIKFQDKILVIRRYPLTKSWIISGLLTFNILESIKFNEMDRPDIYFTLIESKKIKTNYIKGIDNLFNFFLDPLTIDDLKAIGEPTNMLDLLIRAVELLNQDYHEPASSIKNYRIKSIDRINGILYNEIARQYSQSLNDKSRNTPFTINPKAVIMKTIQDQSVVLSEDINPIQYIKERTGVTHGGFLGRDTESFVERDIVYPKDGLGILTEATPDSGKVGFNAFTPLNTTIKNLKGMIAETDAKDLEGGQIFSATAALMPFASFDDPKRINFINVQLSHHIGSENAKPARVRTGLESLIGDFSSPLYATIAKKNGKVLSIDEDRKIFTLQYNNEEEVYIYNYGKQPGEVSNISIIHNIKLNVPVGAFKKDDILAYNTGFFSLDPIQEQLTRIDGCAFTPEFVDQFNFESSYTRTIKLTNDLTIKDMVKIGDQVDYNTPLIILEFADIYTINELKRLKQIDDTENEIFDNLNRIVRQAKYKGYISDIKFYYTGELDSFHKSVQSELLKYIKKINATKRAYDNTTNTEKINIEVNLPVGSRVKKEIIGQDEVLIMINITSEIPASVGDKFVVGNALKTVVGDIIDYPLITKSGVKLDGLFGGKSTFDRVVLSPFKSGLLERLLEKHEEEAVKLYFSE